MNIKYFICYILLWSICRVFGTLFLVMSYSNSYDIYTQLSYAIFGSLFYGTSMCIIINILKYEETPNDDFVYEYLL